MNKKYGCDVVEDAELKQAFSSNFIDDLKKIGVVEILRLNRRKKGMTSSGVELGCHYNVMSLVSAFGGRHKHGFLIEQTNDDNEGLLAFHSAWLTPEKKLVCVTPRGISNRLEKDVFFFMFSDDASLEVNFDDIAYVKGHFCPLNRTSNNGRMITYSISHYRQAKKESRNIKQVELNELVNDCLVNRFKKKSILTKKRFNEIIETPYAKQMRKHFQIAPVNKKQVRKLKKKRDVMSFSFSNA